jgi:AraC-like DNA-binding protein
VLEQPGGEFEAENRLAFITGRLRCHLSHPGDPAGPRSCAKMAYDLRDLTDARSREKVTPREAPNALHAHPAHLVRMFSRESGISPHQHMTSRRAGLARRLLPGGMPPGLAAEVAERRRGCGGSGRCGGMAIRGTDLAVMACWGSIGGA